MNKKILINCSNLHGGGSAAVATSFISFIVAQGLSQHFSLLLSDYVLNNLKSLNINLTSFKGVEILNSRGIYSLFGRLGKVCGGYDVVFTVFGPAYIWNMKKVRHIFGFAQPWIIYPNNLISSSLGLHKKIQYRFKYLIQSIFFRRADLLVVELDHVKKNLLNKTLFKNSQIKIIHSEVDKIFFNPSLWAPCILPDNNPSALKIGIISRNYPHKNLKILPGVKKILENKYSMAVNIFVTFSEMDWSICDSDFQKNILNCGSLTLAQCPSFYKQMDGIIFPSVLECFSAVPIEAMIMRKPLFASRLPFIKDCCKEYCEYIDPLDSGQIAATVAGYFLGGSVELKLHKIVEAYSYASTAFPSGLRGAEYLALITSDSVQAK